MYKFKDKEVNDLMDQVELAWEVSVDNNNTGKCTTNNNASGCGC